jgi:tetratricopeptide (TPR) repeat protein
MNYQLAEDEFREIIRMNPKGAGGHFGLGVALSGGGKRREAKAVYRQAIGINPVFAWVLYLQAVVLGLREGEEAVRKDFRRSPKGDEDQGHFQMSPFP